LPHVVDASHTPFTTRVNRSSMLVKLIEGDVVHTLGEFRT